MTEYAGLLHQGLHESGFYLNNDGLPLDEAINQFIFINKQDITFSYYP